MGVLFVLSAAVQLNDPDPVRWIAIYLGAAILSFAAVGMPVRPVLPALHGSIALVWAAALLPSALETSFAKMFEGVRMMSPAVEEGREELGLAIVAVWMATLAAALLRARHRRDPART